MVLSCRSARGCGISDVFQEDTGHLARHHRLVDLAEFISIVAQVAVVEIL